MRKLTTLFLGLILLTSCGENEVDSSKLVERGGLTYEVNSETPFTGISFTKYGDGQIHEKAEFKNGKRDGPSEKHHENGQLRSKGTYKDGKEEGPWVSYHKNGQLRLKGTLKNGKKDGPWVGYHENGTVWETFTGTFKDGEKISD